MEINSEKKIYLSAPHMSGNEINYISSAIETNWVSPYGQNLIDFESKLESYLGYEDVALTSSGTSAIHLALLGIGVKKGDEVIVPTLNFAGCVNPIIYCGATPVFIDSEPSTWNMNPVVLEETISLKIKQGKKPAAIIAVHLFGIPCLIKEIKIISDKYDIPLIEDSADAIGSTVDGKFCGTFSDAGVLSFNGNKIITTSGGGVVFSHKEGFIAQAKHLSNQARTIKPYYQFDQVGYNYMMSNIIAGIGVAQMEVLEDRLKSRKMIYKTYQEELSKIENLEFHQDLKGNVSNRWLSTIRIVETNSHSSMGLYDYLISKNIESRLVWKPMHQHQAYRNFEYYGGEIAQSIFNNGLCLPSGTGMPELDLERVIEEITSYFN